MENATYNHTRWKRMWSWHGTTDGVWDKVASDWVAKMNGAIRGNDVRLLRT